MARHKTILQSDYPYNIGARCINKEWFQLPMTLVWEIFCEELNRTISEYNLSVHSFVLMSNHYHLIASTPDANISQCMHQFMARTSKRLTKEGNRINETFAGRHYKCILNNYNYYLNAYKYNYRNPVTAGACIYVEEYPFSSIYGLVNPKKALLKICNDPLFQENKTHTLKWLNTEPDPLKLEAVQHGLRKQFFASKKNNITGWPLISENEHL